MASEDEESPCGKLCLLCCCCCRAPVQRSSAQTEVCDDETSVNAPLLPENTFTGNSYGSNEARNDHQKSSETAEKPRETQAPVQMGNSGDTVNMNAAGGSTIIAPVVKDNTFNSTTENSTAVNYSTTVYNYTSHAAGKDHQKSSETAEKPRETQELETSQPCQSSVNNDEKTSRENTSSKTMGKDHSDGKSLSVVHHIKNSWSSKIADGNNENLPMFKLHLSETWKNRDGFWRRSTFGRENIIKENKTIMMIGATGSGKTTLINSMINYILGVEWEDDFRFVLIDEGKQKSQASEITAYQINHMDGFRVPYSLTIVDTPGFGDTRGISHDQKITKMIQEFFSNPGGIDRIDAVCFVVQASLARLTPTQKLIFDSILSIFGKDIAENILVLVTFADGKTPPVLEAIKVCDVPCAKNKSGEPLHFKFNNSAVFANSKSAEDEDEDCNKSAEDEDSDCENFDQMFWKMGVSSMRIFFTSLRKMETKSLTLTQEVLKERQQLEVLVEGLQPQINAGLMKLDEIKKTRAALEQHKAEMEANKDYEYEKGRISKEKIFEELENELEVVQDTVIRLIKESQESLERLEEIALKPNPLSVPDYIDLMIESEKQERKPGFQERIQSLMAVRKKAEIISKIPTGKLLSEDWKTYKSATRKKVLYDPRVLFSRPSNH